LRARTDGVPNVPKARHTRRPKRGFCLALGFLLLAARSVVAHPAPFSYFDLRVVAGRVEGTLVVHVYDAAFELQESSPATLLDAKGALDARTDLIGLLNPRISLLIDGQVVPIIWGSVDPVPERQSLRLNFTAGSGPPSRIQLRASLFPYDPAHQTFVNVYEGGALKHQAILDAGNPNADYYSGSPQGRLFVIRTFVLSGIEHILIGPDHVLFLIGLLLLRGTLVRLALIVTAFTIGHSITLTLAALDILAPSASLIEPLIALTIVIVGVDNLLVLKAKASGGQPGVDIRAWLAVGFGLIHGFGFASVLKEFGLPQAALGWSLFAFNLGVEIGQLFIVTVVALVLAALAKRSLAAATLVARVGSVAVILAGLYWFVERTFFQGAVA
jgi:hypothetical protein